MTEQGFKREASGTGSWVVTVLATVVSALVGWCALVLLPGLLPDAPPNIGLQLLGLGIILVGLGCSFLLGFYWARLWFLVGIGFVGPAAVQGAVRLATEQGNIWPLEAVSLIAYVTLSLLMTYAGRSRRRARVKP